MDELNIYQRLLKITEELTTVKKGLTVGKGENAYKAVGEKEVLQAVKPLEIKYGVYSEPVNREIVMQEIVEQDKGTYKKTLFFMRIKTTYRFTNVDKPDDYTEQISLGDGIDPLDKAPGKAMTYSDKYSLLKAYKIETGDDPDKNHSDDTVIIKKSYTPKKTNHSSLGDMSEKDAAAEANKIGLANIMGSLNKDENKEHKPVVVKTMCDELKVDKWADIKFTDKLTYQVFTEKVKVELQNQKDLAAAGI